MTKKTTPQFNLFEVFNSLPSASQKFLLDFFSNPILIDVSDPLKMLVNLYVTVNDDGFEEKLVESLRSTPQTEEEFWAEEDEDRPYEVTDGTLIVPVTGTLYNKYDYSTKYSTGYSYLQRTYTRGLADPEVERIVSRIDSGGGEGAGNMELSSWLAEQRGSKQLIASVDDLAASAAYNIAAAHDEILMSTSAEVGSVGVRSQHTSLAELLKNEGIDITYIFAGDRKVDGNPFQKLSARAKSRMQARVDKMYGEFTQLVADNRNLSLQEVVDTQADVYDSEEALANGFADRVESFEETISAFSAEATDTTKEGFPMTTKAKNNSTSQNEASQESQEVDTAKIAADAKQAERDRNNKVQSSPEYKGREALANKLLFNSEMDAEQIIDTIKDVPTASVEKPEEKSSKESETKEEADSNDNRGKSHLEEHMDKHGSPNVESDDAGEEGDTPTHQKEAASILANYKMNGGEVVDHKTLQ